MICAALVNTQTYRQTAFGRLYYTSSAEPAELKLIFLGAETYVNVISEVFIVVVSQ